MNDKVWVNCPCCGAAGSMEYRENVFDKMKVKDYPDPIEVGPLCGYFCKICGDGFYTKDSVKKLELQVLEGISLQTKNKNDQKTD